MKLTFSLKLTFLMSYQSKNFLLGEIIGKIEMDFKISVRFAIKKC
jgi:hypothetical protein